VLLAGGSSRAMPASVRSLVLSAKVLIVICSSGTKFAIYDQSVLMEIALDYFVRAVYAFPVRKGGAVEQYCSFLPCDVKLALCLL